MKKEYNFVDDVFAGYEFPKIDKPIAENGDSEKITKYLVRLANDDVFLEKEANAIAKEVEEMLVILEGAGIVGK